MSEPTKDIRVVIVGAQSLIGEWTEPGGMPHLIEPLLLVPVPAGGGSMGWIMVPFPVPDIELTFVTAYGVPERVYVEQYTAQLVELQAARAGITVPPSGKAPGPRLVR